MKKIIYLLAVILVVACNKKEHNSNATTKSAPSIISIGGATTETIFALGAGQHVKAVDVTSTYPNQVHTLPKLGHLSNISFENALSFNPTNIISIDDQSGTSLFEQVKQSSTPLNLVKAPQSVDDTKALITEIGAVLQKEEEAEALIKIIDADLAALNDYLSSQQEDAPRVLFIYSRGSDMLMVGGSGTTADAMITLAGGENVGNSFEGFKPLSPEAVIRDNPDVILLFNSGLESLDGIEGVLKMPGIAETNAGKNKKIVAMDGHYLLGFGPRVGEAALELAKNIR